jgi:hypothetical protein
LDVWFLGGLLFPWAESLALAVRFSHGLDLRETLGNKGFGELSTLFDKFIFELLAFFIGNLPAMIHVPCVASNNGTPTITKQPR